MHYGYMSLLIPRRLIDWFGHCEAAFQRAENFSNVVIIARAKGTTHTPSIKLLETIYKLHETALKHIFRTINTIAI